jgi:hypothetical protein
MIVDPKAQAHADAGIAAIRSLLDMVPQKPDPVVVPKISIADASARESDRIAYMRVTSDVVLPRDIFLKVRLIPGTATADDFVSVEQADQLFRAGLRETLIPIAFVDDNKVEPDETAEVEISVVVDEDNPVTIVRGRATVTIINDDVEPPPPTGEVPVVLNPAPLLPAYYDAMFLGVTVDGREYDGMNPLVISGLVALDVVGRNRYGSKSDSGVTKMRLLVDNEPVTGVVNLPYFFDTNTLDDGEHALSLYVIDGVNLANKRAISIKARVRNGDQLPLSAPQTLVALGPSVQSTRRNYRRVERVQWPGGKPPQARPIVRNIPYSTPIYARAGDPGSWMGSHQWALYPFSFPKHDLYQSIPAFFQTKDGDPTIGRVVDQAGNTATNAEPHVTRHWRPGGPAQQHHVSNYSTPTWELDGKAVIAVDLDGLVTRWSRETGNVEIVAGYKPKDDVLPLLPDSSVPVSRFRELQELVGEFPEGHWFKGAHDIVPCPWLPGVYFVAASFFHTVDVLDTRGAKPRAYIVAGVHNQIGDTEGPALSALLDRPYSVEVTPDRKVIVTCTGREKDGTNAAIKVIDGDFEKPETLTVRTLFRKGDQSLYRPFATKADGFGTYIAFEHETGRAFKLGADLSTLTLFMTGLNRVEPLGWVWPSIDKTGSCGYKGDFFWVTSINSPGNTTVQRFKADGTLRRIETIGGGKAQSQRLNTCQEPFGHYGWYLVPHPSEALMIATGFGNVGMAWVRCIEPGEKFGGWDFNAPVFPLGLSTHYNGSLPGFPCYMRPAMTALRGEYGMSFLGVETWEDIGDITFAEFASRIHNGWNGSIPRPEIVGFPLQALWFAIQYTAGKAVPEPARPADRTPPKVYDLVAERIGPNKARFRWRTEEPTTGAIGWGFNNVFHECAMDYTPIGTVHEQVVDVSETTVSYVVRVADLAGNESQSIARVLPGV